ncbi:MAG TPA: AbrB/MazE/SpoVT family DNA-binding domain-containing protein [Symbiobacteriaceae bacterium]|nr:AbrB/MazE/SpoVT family DNA-binding domain-containing protein [Symbiobacteriaceae bacterium]
MKAGLKSSGFVRRLDELGRIVLPVEWRRTFGLEPGSPLEMILGGDGTLMLKRYIPSGTCTFCGEVEEIRHFAGRPICRKCTDQLAAGQGA